MHADRLPMEEHCPAPGCAGLWNVEQMCPASFKAEQRSFRLKAEQMVPSSIEH